MGFINISAEKDFYREIKKSILRDHFPIKRFLTGPVKSEVSIVMYFEQ